MEKWVVMAKKADFQEIGKKFGIDPVIARLIRNRDVEGMDDIRSYLYGTLDDIPSPWLLKDMKKAAEILSAKIDSGAKIRIIGDYDIDGVTSRSRCGYLYSGQDQRWLRSAQPAD